tara:strand:+ start:799 stop:1110 length:312 start_codon:yes stop_codon:yes gene_type:complete
MEKTDRGWTMESYRNYMKRRDAEEQMIKEERLAKATDKQVGGSHYKDFKIMPIEYITKNKLDFCEGNIVKYISRHEKKNGAEDIRKVIHYAELILEQKYGKDN